jgi:hypothetical protein
VLEETNSEVAVLERSSAYDQAIELVERTLKDVSGTSITSTSIVVDMLLDMRNLVELLEGERLAAKELAN